MTDFYETDLGVAGMSRDDLDAIALRGGVVGGIGFGYATRGAVPSNRHGYGFRWVGTKGMGNYGDLVLVPRSDRAAEYIRQGRVAALMTANGLTYSDADALYSASKGIRHAHEAGVIAYAVATRDCVPAWSHFPGVGGGVWRWFGDWRMPATDLSAPRLWAVAQILAAWR